MKKVLTARVASFATLVAVGAHAETAKEYADKCKDDLGFTASDVPTLNCNDGVQFKGSLTSGATLDYVGAKKLNSSTDLVFVCRWMNDGILNADSAHIKNPPFSLAASIEMIIHNKATGETCFFAGKPPTETLGGGLVIEKSLPTTIVSPFGSTSSVNTYWMSPVEIDTKIMTTGDPDAPLRCVGCHVAGPYIASASIVGSLARFGLINDGHDTFAAFDSTSDLPQYHVVGSNEVDRPADGNRGFKAWNSYVRAALGPNACSNGCHSVGMNSTATTIRLGTEGAIQDLIPSLKDDRVGIEFLGLMPPSDPASDYRWMNSDGPGGTGDYETLEHQEDRFPRLFNDCDDPTRLEAHVVGSDLVFATDDFPDKLSWFNLQDGLRCLNSQQADGQCSDYSTRYLCRVTRTVMPFPPGSGSPTQVTSEFWTDWLNVDPPSGNGDYERRSDMPSTLCLSPSGGLPVQGTPIAMEAMTRYQVVPGVFITRTGYAPTDRLAAFDPSVGLKCKPADQPGSQACQDYVVRFQCL